MKLLVSLDLERLNDAESGDQIRTLLAQAANEILAGSTGGELIDRRGDVVGGFEVVSKASVITVTTTW